MCERLSSMQDSSQKIQLVFSSTNLNPRVIVWSKPASRADSKKIRAIFPNDTIEVYQHHIRGYYKLLDGNVSNVKIMF